MTETAWCMQYWNTWLAGDETFKVTLGEFFQVGKLEAKMRCAAPRALSLYQANFGWQLPCCCMCVVSQHVNSLTTGSQIGREEKM